MKDQLSEAKADTEYEDHVVEHLDVREVSPISTDVSTGTWILTCRGFALLVVDELGTDPPVVGATVRLFGRGLGYPVRGIGRVEQGELTALYRYCTAGEAQARAEREIAERKREQHDAWESKKEQTAATIKALPEVFQKRIEFFMRREGWGPELGPYELFCCVEAVKIASALKTEDKIQAFYGLGIDEQKVLVADVDYAEHSGNTFGTACMLARLYVARPELVPKMHGALCPLVGCDASGCYASVRAGGA